MQVETGLGKFTGLMVEGQSCYGVMVGGGDQVSIGGV